MSDPRYRVVVGMLDDPLNRAAITRELLRRGKLPMIPPPIQVRTPDGVKFGWIFPTLREAMRGLPSQITPRQMGEIEGEVTVYTDDHHWFVGLVNEDGVELGPFDSASAALKEARGWLEGEGYLLLDSLPWDEDDTHTYALKL